MPARPAAGAERFPKTLFAFWRREPGRGDPATPVVSPAHRDRAAETAARLAVWDLPIAWSAEVGYPAAAVRSLYPRCPWRDLLAGFVGEVCPDRTAIALTVCGGPGRLDRLGRFKLAENSTRWPRGHTSVHKLLQQATGRGAGSPPAQPS